MKQDFKISNEVYRAIYEIYKTGETGLAEKLPLPGKAIVVALCYKSFEIPLSDAVYQIHNRIHVITSSLSNEQIADMANLVQGFWPLIEEDRKLADKLKQLSRLKRNFNIIDTRFPKLLYDNYISIELRVIDDSLPEYDKMKIILYGPKKHIELSLVVYSSKLSGMWSKIEVSGSEVDMIYLRHFISLAIQELLRT